MLGTSSSGLVLVLRHSPCTPNAYRGRTYETRYQVSIYSIVYKDAAPPRKEELRYGF